jgi:serine/threonine protein kinase
MRICVPTMALLDWRERLAPRSAEPDRNREAAMAVSSAEQFFAVLTKSKLLSPAQTAEARSLAAGITDPVTVAKRLARQRLITRWQAGQLMAGRSSFYLGKYRLIELLGGGGMGRVFLAQHVGLNRRVALKTIARQVGRDPASLDRFLAEARAIATLDHPNIVQAFSVDNEGERYYLVMEYVEGMDLQRLVEREGPLDAARAVDYIRQAADGLQHAHQQNMIHCDIKPSNLMVNMQGVVKILDLGLARLGDEEENAPDERTLGSVDYMAPEEALKSRDRDGRADIYSLGCTLYFVLTGHPPFPQGTLPERILKHQTQEPPDLRSEQPKISAELAAICKRMMAKRPEDRYATAAEASRVLAQCRLSMPTLKRAVPLLRAKPLDDWSDPEMSGVWRKLADSQAVRVLDEEPDAVCPEEPQESPARTAPAGWRRVFGVILFVVLALMAIAAVALSMWLDLDTQVLQHPAGGSTKAPTTATQPESPPKTK